MGTSRPKPDAPPGSPLIPPWADQDPPAPPPPPNPLPEEPEPLEQSDIGPPADEVVDGLDDADLPEVAEPKRYLGFRTALGRFATTGDRADARTALGRWASKSVGGGAAGSPRNARAVRTGGAALAGLARAGAGQAPTAGALDIRTLAGQPTDTAINAILDAFMPAGILDEVAARLAMEQALVTALDGMDIFNPAMLNDNAIRIATLAFVAELVFVQVAGDPGQSLAKAGPIAAAQREADVRSLVHEVVDLVGTPILATAGAKLSAQHVANLVSQLTRETFEEMATW